MLPPPPATTLREANPHFSLLYDHLITNILYHDGSARSTTVEHDAVAGKLSETRKAILRDEILLRALEEVALISESVEPPYETMHAGARVLAQIQQDGAPARLSPELKDLILNIVSYLSISLDPDTSGSLAPDTNDLMTEELEAFYHHLPEISRHLSQHLINTESSLATLATALSPSTNSQAAPKSFTSRRHEHTNITPSTPSLSESLISLTTSTSTIQTTTLPALLDTTTQNLSTLLSDHAQNLHSTIRDLELTTHGTSARHITARATYLNAVSRGMEMKAQMLRLEREKALYADEALLDMLSEEHDALQSQERRLRKRERDLSALLAEYEEAGREAVVRNSARGGQMATGSGEDIFRVLGARYAEIEGELDAVKADVERLEAVWLRPRESRAR